MGGSLVSMLTAFYTSIYDSIRVLILLYMCPHTTVYTHTALTTTTTIQVWWVGVVEVWWRRLRQCCSARLPAW